MGNSIDELGDDMAAPISTNSPLDISNFSINGNSKKMRQQMLDDVFVMEGIAILGQSTVIYAAPNTGKTLLSLHLLIDAVSNGNVQANSIFYVNADDTHKGRTEKLEIAEAVNIQMVVPDEKGFKADLLPEIIESMVATGSARGKVIVLDTLKKFTNLMDKNIGSKFGDMVRTFVGGGGTVISLAHVNKHKDSDGKSVHAGTTDIKDDADCVFIADVANSNGDTKTVIFENTKNRGDVEKHIGFRYQQKKGKPYSDLLASIERVCENTIERERKSQRLKEQAKENRLVINEIAATIRGGICKRTELTKEVNQRTGVSLLKVNKVLNSHTGNSRTDYKYWTYTTERHNAQVFRLNKETAEFGVNV